MPINPVRAIDEYWPFSFASYPLEASVAQIASTSVVDYAEAFVSPGMYPVDLVPSAVVNLALIEGKYFIYNQGIGFYKDYLALQKSGMVLAKVHRLPSAAIMEENLYTLHGITPEELEQRDALVADQLEVVMEDFRSNPVAADMFSVEESAMNELGLKKIKTSSVEIAISTYLQNYPTVGASDWPRVPMLTGGTGIAKTSIIESIIKKIPSKWGYRLVTLKSGFIDKSDLMGFVKVQDTTIDGITKRVAQDSPMKELLTATDSFVQSCRDLVTYADEQLEPRNAEDEKVYSIAKEYAKTPVMFWDELNRTSPAILPQIMVIVCSKRLQNYKFEMSPMLAAINANLSTKDGLEGMYKVAQITDPAMIDRFPPLIMSPTDPSLLGSFQETMLDKWGGKVPKVDILMKKLNDYKINGIGLLYNEELYVNADNAETTGANLTYELKFPTFRGWDMVFDYMYSKISLNLPINLEYIKGIIGEEAGNALFKITKTDIAFKGVYNIVENPDANLHTLFLKDSFDSGIPCLLTGRFGIAKTAKITAEIEKHGGVVVNCDLSAQDKVTIRGMPDQQSMQKNMFGDSDKSPLAAKLGEITKDDPFFPQYTTVNTPFNFAFVVQKCVNEGTMLCLVFDEINRCSPIVMSGVFDAISDKKFLGVDLSSLYERKLIRIIAAGNVGEIYDVGGSSGERDMDAAVMARFASARVDKMDSTDIDSFMAYARKSFTSKDGSASPFVTILQTMPVGDLLKIFSLDDVDAGDLALGTNLSSFRTMTFLNAKIKTNEGYMFKFEPSAPIDIRVNDYYLGFLYGDGIMFDDTDGEEISYKDFLLKVRAEPDLYTREEIIETMQQAEDIMYSGYWKPAMYGKYSTAEQTMMYQNLMLSVEKAMFAKYNIYEVTAETIESHIVMAAGKSDIRSITEPSMARMILELCSMRIQCDISNGNPALTTSGFRDIITEAVKGAAGRVVLTVSESDINLVLTKLLEAKTGIVDDMGAAPTYGDVISLREVSYGYTTDQVTDLLAKLSPIYEVETEVEVFKNFVAEDAVGLSLMHIAYLGLADFGKGYYTLKVAPYLTALKDGKATQALYILSSGQNMSSLVLFHMTPTESKRYKLRLREGVGLTNVAVNYSTTSFLNTAEDATNMVKVLTDSDQAIIGFEGQSKGTKLEVLAYCFPFAMSDGPANLEDTVIQLRSLSVAAASSVSGNPEDMLASIEAEVTKPLGIASTTDKMLDSAYFIGTLHAWNGAINTAFSIINAAFKPA